MNPIDLETDETLEDLQRGKLRLIQKIDGFRLGEDSVFLAAFAAGMVRGRRQIRAVDVGAGCGAVSLLLAGRLPQIELTAIEISARPYGVLQRNLALNGLNSRISAVHGDARNLSQFPKASLDLIVSNPPYRDPKRHLAPMVRGNPELAAEWRTAVEMTSLSINDLMAASACWLKPGGLLALVQRPANLPDILASMQKNRIEPIALQAIVPLPGRAPTSILVAGRSQGRPGSFRWLPDLIVNMAPGLPSPQTRQIYGEQTPHDG